MDKKKLISIVAGVLAVVLVLSLVLGLLIPSASAASSSQIKQEIDKLNEKNEAMQSQIDALKNQQSSNLSDISEMVNQKSVIEQQVGLLHAQVQNVNEQIAAYSVLIADKQEELDASELYLKELNDKHKERIRIMEEGGQLSYWSVLFQANNFSDFLDRMNMIQEIEASDNRRLTELKTAALKVAEAKDALLTEKDALQKTKEDLAVMQAELKVKSKEAEDLLAQLVAKGEEFEKAMLDYESDLAELEKEIAQKESDYKLAKEEEMKSDYGVGDHGNYGSGGGLGGSVKTDSNGIRWVVPCDYANISSAYGWRTHPVYHDKRFHHGVDMNADCLMDDATGTTDSPIYAARGGVVIVSKYHWASGYNVTIDHGDGYRSTYMHMCEFPYVNEGDFVTAGQIIGCIGTTGTSTGDHLHFGIYYNGDSVNPMNHIG